MIYVFLAALLTAFLCIAFSHKLKLREYEVFTEKLKSGLRIVQVSDLHDCTFGKEQEKLAKLICDAKPDVIFFTGDIVNDTPEFVEQIPILSNAHPVKKLINRLCEIAPVYMVYGNHEANIPNVEELSRELSELGIKLIGQKSVKIHINGQETELFGIDDPRFFGAGKQNMTLRERLFDDMTRTSPGLEKWRGEVEKMKPSPDKFSILLSHRPEEYKLYGKFDITFSGHAHGGQWRIPFILNGLYAPHQGLFPKHAGGRYELEHGTHIVSRGLSLIRCPRIFNRPEVCLVVVKVK